MVKSRYLRIHRNMEILVSFAAVPVLLGALFKIVHVGGDIWLWIGLGTEAFIFFMYGVMYFIAPPPFIGEDGVPIDAMSGKAEVKEPKISAPAIEHLDKMMQTADITPETLAKLSDGFKRLEATTNNLGEVSRAVSVITAEDTNRIKEQMGQLSDNLTKLNEVYGRMLDSMRAN
ncbi:MAG: hypothetical protein LBE82_11310 [Chitinophagaceae bacterium]|jgi:hypothetical protein|nr:hypothetical protein [Chitinophagaceae bacterium]